MTDVSTPGTPDHPNATPVTGAAAGANPFGIETLDAAECREVLTRQRLCVVATADGEWPYALPLFYGFDGTTVYLGISEGRKTRILDANPNVCVAVTEVGPGDAWRSVLVTGRAVVVTDPEQRASAVQVLMRHNRRPERQEGQSAPPPAAPARRHSGGRIVVVADAEITGRGKR